MDHEQYMARCLQLASNGFGTVSPNPLVGSIIVHKGKIIGEGWHYKSGLPHAEVNAIFSVKQPLLLKESTLYVNLEPCAHHGKTPPCSDLIIEKKIPRVVVGCRDPFSEVNGKGIEKMRKAGIEVIENVLKDKCLEINRRFFTFHQKKRPYIVLKWAQTLDGYIDINRKDGTKGPNWITGKETKILVHKWRAAEDAVLIGRKTAENDNPLLTVREMSGKNPVRLLIDPQLKTPADAAVFNNESPTVVFNYKQDSEKGNLSYIKLDKSFDILQQILEYCYKSQLQSIFIEGGAQTLQAFIDADLWDEARVFTGPKIFGNGIEAPALPQLPFDRDRVGDDELLIFRNI